jgi:hypothetical protein
MNTWTYASLIGAALVFAILYLRERRRSVAIQALAGRSGFNYLGRGVPRSLTLRGTPLDRVTSIWNVIDGDKRGLRIIAFDCQIGTGKGSWRRTVIAVKTHDDGVASVASKPDLTVDHSGDWIILYQDKTPSLISGGLMRIDELEARLNAIAK